MKNSLHTPERLRGLARRFWKDLAIYAAIALVTGLHYATDPMAHQLHDIYRRLYYLPIILAAFQHGLAGGVVAALVACLAYLPHALGHVSHDPASATQKTLEMILYLAVGVTTGFLVSRLKRAQHALEATAEELRGSLDTLRAAEQELIQSARLATVGRLSAGLAHEIRNPLASIKGSAELLTDEFPPEHRKRRLLEVLIEESGRLNDVLTRFLAFARPRPIEPGAVDMKHEIEAVVALLETQPATNAVRFVIGANEPVRVRGDAAQLRQVLLNLLLNACQSAGAGGEVRLGWTRAGQTVRVSVHDSGHGFTPEAMANAFTPFFTTRPRGTGLGLAESHGIIEAHGGRILLANHESGGALVTLELPAI